MEAKSIKYVSHMWYPVSFSVKRQSVLFCISQLCLRHAVSPCFLFVCFFQKMGGVMSFICGYHITWEHFWATCDRHEHRDLTFTRSACKVHKSPARRVLGRFQHHRWQPEESSELSPVSQRSQYTKTPQRNETIGPWEPI